MPLSSVPSGRFQRPLDVAGLDRQRERGVEVLPARRDRPHDAEALARRDRDVGLIALRDRRALEAVRQWNDSPSGPPVYGAHELFAIWNLPLTAKY